MTWAKEATVKFDGAGSGGKVRIKTKTGELGLTDLEKDATRDTVALARAITSKCIAWLSWPDPARQAQITPLEALYFVTGGGGLTKGERALVISKLELAMNGINAKVDLKLHPNPQGAHGYVNFKPDAVGVARGIFSPRHTLGSFNNQSVSRGDIHLGRHRLQNIDKAAITFVHEAMHKYASLADHGGRGYLRDVGGADDGTYYIEPGLTKAEALNNADSYAFFCSAAYANLT